MASNPVSELDLLASHARHLGIGAERYERVRRVDTTVDGRRVSGLRWGDAVPDVVCLHGGGQNAHTWDGMLLRSDRPALALDLPGHGRSSWLPGGVYLPRDTAPILARALTDLAPTPQVVVGMSMGGLNAICLAAWFPELVRRLVVVDVSPGGTPDRARDITDFATTEVFPSFDDLVRKATAFRPTVPVAALRRSLHYNARARRDGTWTWRHDRRDPPGEHRLDRVYRDLPSYWSVAGAVRCPTTLVIGGRSPIVSGEDVARYRAEMPQLDVVRIDDAGHSVQGDQPEALLAVVESMLAP